MIWESKMQTVLLLSLSSFLTAQGSSILRAKDLNETYSSIPSNDTQSTEECDCGIYGVCHFENGLKKCRCARLTNERDGQCIECDCGISAYGCHLRGDGTKACFCDTGYIDVNGKCTECNCGENKGDCSFESDGTKICKCAYGYIYFKGKCTECYCGHHSVCTFELGIKKCICSPGYIEIDGKCVANISSSTVSSTLMTKIFTSTVTSCDCGVGGSCYLDSFEEKICNCYSGYALYDGVCHECDCGSNGKCDLEEKSGKKICLCDEDYAENGGTCDYCYCGENSKSCRFNVFGEKECNCSSGYAKKYEYCEECNCGPLGWCSFEYGRKRCNCSSFAVEKNGWCVEIDSTTLELSTPMRTTVLPSTTKYCNCGKYSNSCRFNWMGYKICDCLPGFVENNGTCQNCNCGPYGSCSFEFGRKRCKCKSFAFEKNGLCIEREPTTSEVSTTFRTTVPPSTTQYCNCGEYSKSCRFNWKGNKICDCIPGYIENHGTCEAICNEDKCMQGKCEIVGNSFKCRCYEGFTGLRCEVKVETKSNKPNLWIVLLVSMVFAIFLLLSCMFCFWTRALNKMSKK